PVRLRQAVVVGEGDDLAAGGAPAAVAGGGRAVWLVAGGQVADRQAALALPARPAGHLTECIEGRGVVDDDHFVAARFELLAGQRRQTALQQLWPGASRDDDRDAGAHAAFPG